MIIQEISIIRSLPIFIAQPIASIIYIFLAIKLVRRKRNQTILFLFLLYISFFLITILNLVYIFFIVMDLIDFLYPLYFFMVFITLFSQIFLLLFVLNIFHLKIRVNLTYQLTLIFIYGFIIILILNLPDMITLDPENNYRPVYSWNFITIVFIFYTSFITIPTLFTSLNIYSRIEKSFLKKKFKKFLIGTTAIIISFYGVSFFNAFENQYIRLIWSIDTFLVFIGSSILFYQTFGKEV